MKVILINSPVIRFNTDNPEHDPRINSLKLKIKLFSWKYPRIWRYLDSLGIAKGARFGVRAGSRWPWTSETPLRAIHFPFMMAYATSYLRYQGVDALLIDAIAEEEYNYKCFIQRVRNESPDIVIIECSTPTIDIDLWMAKEISKFCKVALAGPHLTEENATDIQSKYPEISFLLKGEYIKSSYQMLQSQKPGIYESDLVMDLDSIPFPFRDFHSSTKYFDPSMPTECPQLQMYGSKGCPFKCSFCMWPQVMYGGKVAFRSPKKISEEIRECIQKYGFNSIFFDDDTFNIGEERISELCDELKNIGIPWTMMGRLDCSPEWLYDKMVESGCVGMRFGIESFNLQVLKNINKGLERVNFLEILTHICTRYPNLMIHVTMMKNMPGQTKDIHQKDLEILHSLGFDNSSMKRSYQISSCVPFPGTRLYNELVEKHGANNINNYSKYDGAQETIVEFQSEMKNQD